MTTNHTPGPWSLETVRTSSGVCHKVGPFPGRREDEKPRHACLYADYPSESNPADQELLANARLIATAPELLDLLSALECDINTLVYCYERKPDNFGRAVAVAKADAERARAVISKARGAQ